MLITNAQCMKMSPVLKKTGENPQLCTLLQATQKQMGPWHFSERWGLAPLLIRAKAERTKRSVQPRSQLYHIYLCSLTPNPLQDGEASRTRDVSVTRHLIPLIRMTI